MSVAWLKSVPIAALLCVTAACAKTSSSTAETSPPVNWPIAGLTLPAGTRDAEFTPGPLREVADKLPRKRRMGSVRSEPPPPQWNAFFGFTGSPSDVFDHIDKFLVGKRFVAEQIRDLEVGTENESRSHTYLSQDKHYSIALRYWKVSDLPGAKPYQLLVRDVRKQYNP
jgi:hypothetical protein